MSTEPNSEPRTGLVLGASGTLGAAIAAALSGRGFRLALHAHQHPERCPSLENAEVFTADFREADQIKDAAKKIVKALGRVDACVWSAGVVNDKIAAKLTPDEMREVLAVDLTAPFLWCKALARTFLKQRSGSVLLLSSHAAFSGRVGGAAYASAQSGLLALMKSLAREWGASGVRVNALVPPFVAESGMGRASSPAFAEAVQKRSLLKTDADPVAAVSRIACEILETETASGQVFVVDSRVAG